ncbi:MAG: porin family protein [Chitinophagaceae bacterium]|nr:porin family protein [Chitinophagaceae bacterium]
MHPLSDKDLDRLSRQAAEQYDVDQNTSGWDKLEQTLNKHLPQTGRKERRRFLFFVWLLALLSGGGLLWILTGNNDPQITVLKQGTALSESPALKNTEAGQSSRVDRSADAKTNHSQQKKDGQVLPVPGSEAIAIQKRKESLTGKPIVRSNTGVTIVQSNPDKKNAFRNVVAANNIIINTKKKNRKNRRFADETSSIPESSEPGDEFIKKDDQRHTASAHTKKTNDDSSATTSVTQNKPELSIDTAAQSMAEQTNIDSASNSVTKKPLSSKNKAHFRKGFEIGAVGAPDMSTVKFKNTDKAGFIVGIQLGYRLSQRWSVNTGVLYTKKNYSSLGKDFNPPKGTWLDNVQLDKVDGHCYMFDIPLNVRYDLNTNNNYRFFVNTGLSTYLMKKEDYHYYYQYTNGTPGYRYRSLSSNGNHWLSILNISAGFEKNLNKHFSLQAEPYLKIPVRGIGFGNLQLNSYGMYFSLKYHVNRR